MNSINSTFQLPNGITHSFRGYVAIAPKKLIQFKDYFSTKISTDSGIARHFYLTPELYPISAHYSKVIGKLSYICQCYCIWNNGFIGNTSMTILSFWVIGQQRNVQQLKSLLNYFIVGTMVMKERHREYVTALNKEKKLMHWMEGKKHATQENHEYWLATIKEIEECLDKVIESNFNYKSQEYVDKMYTLLKYLHQNKLVRFNNQSIMEYNAYAPHYKVSIRKIIQP